MNVNGSWYTQDSSRCGGAAASTGAPIIADFARNWAYDARWGPMMGHQPVPGEQMGFFLSAGNARGEGGVSSVRERTNVVIVSLPAGDSGIFTCSRWAPFDSDDDAARRLRSRRRRANDNSPASTCLE